MTAAIDGRNAGPRFKRIHLYIYSYPGKANILIYTGVQPLLWTIMWTMMIVTSKPNVGYHGMQTWPQEGFMGSRHRPEQLIPDGLSPSEHLRSALNTRHPYVDGAVSTTAVTQALGLRQFSAEQLLAWRCKMRGALMALALATSGEDALFLDLVHPLIGKVLRAYTDKNVATMRELWFITQPPDYSAVAALCVGLPMLGWAPPAFGLLPRVKGPVNSYGDWKRGAGGA